MATPKEDMEITNEVPDDWELNSLLLDLNQNTADEELESMKFMFSGTGGIGKKALSETKTTLQFFQLLKERGFLDRNNILFLQGLYWKISKSNHRKIVQYAKGSRQKPVYFFKASDAAVNGYSNAEFHLAGSELSRQKVEEIRCMVARIVGISPEFVFWKGAKPFNSIILTFMMPDDVLDLLLNLTSEEKGYLIGLNIDKFTAEDKEVTLKGQSYDLPKVISEEQEIHRLMSRSEKMEKQIEKMELKLLEKTKQDQSLCEQQQDDLHQKFIAMNQKIETQTKQLDAYNAMIERSYNQALITITALVNMIFNNHQSEDVPKLSQQSVLAYFRLCLDRVKRECPDKMDCIYELINSASLIAVESERQKWKHHIESINLQNRFLQIEHVELLTLLDTKPMIIANRPLQSFILSMNSRQSIGVKPQLATVSGSATVHIETVVPDVQQTALMHISNLLTVQQRHAILDNSKLSPIDKKKITENPSLTMLSVVPIEKDVVGLRQRVLDVLDVLRDKQLLRRVHQIFDVLGLPGSLPVQHVSTKEPKHILRNKKRHHRRT